MSRPPRPHYEVTTTGELPPAQSTIDYLPLEHADLLDLAVELAAEELSITSEGEQGDFGRSLMDLSALVAHVLAVYQDRYASEAFLSTARSARSLVRHGRRLGYEPDPGLAAKGYAALVIGEDLSGTIPAGFALASSPVGEKKAQDYETLTDNPVSADHNELELLAATKEAKLTATATELLLPTTGLGLEPQDWLVLSGPGYLGGHKVVSATETKTTTTVTITPAYPGGATSDSAGGFTVYAHPASRLRLLGWNSSPTTYTDAELQAGAYPGGTTGTRVGYVAASHSTQDIYFDGQPDDALTGQPVLRLLGTSERAFTVTQEQAMTVTFRRTTEQSIVSGIDLSKKKPTTTTSTIDIDASFGGPVAAVRLLEEDGTVPVRTSQDIRNSVWLTHWEIAESLAATVPNPDTVDATALALSEVVDDLVPGQLLQIATKDESDTAVVEISTVSEATTGSTTHTVIGYNVLASSSAGITWTLGDFEVSGNVVTISHGKTIDEVLGGSDGTTPFLRFELSDSPLTYLPGAAGGESTLEIRVGGVKWEAVEDFHDSRQDDLHYRVLRDEEGVTTVLFGDGINGAVPSFGKKHVTAKYRVGLGTDGNADAGQVGRIKKANPLVESVTNPLPLTGGAEPAKADDVRSQATRYIRSFDRAVSVQDHADLALLFPGVTRAAADWSDMSPLGPRAVRVYVADSNGEQPGTLSAIDAFLRERRDNAVALSVVGVTPVDVQLWLYLEIDAARLVDEVKDAVRDALHGTDPAGMFTFAARDLGQPAFLSEIYEVVDDVAGVEFAQVTRFEAATATAGIVADTVTAEAGQWVRLAPANLHFSIPSGGA